MSQPTRMDDFQGGGPWIGTLLEFISKLPAIMDAGGKAKRGFFAVDGKGSAQGRVHSALAKSCPRKSPLSLTTPTQSHVFGGTRIQKYLGLTDLA